MSWSVPVKIGFDLPELRAVEDCTSSKCFNTDSAELGACCCRCHCCGLAVFAEARDAGGPWGAKRPGRGILNMKSTGAKAILWSDHCP